MISVSNLKRYYGTFPAVDDVSFEVGKGQIWGLLGPNGAGKTTLMKILTGFHFPTSGTAQVKGIDVVDQTTDVQALVGYLPEMAPLYKEMTVREYLGFICDARSVLPSEMEERIQSTAAECGIADVLERGIDTLSKGYRQRVGLAQAIIHQPEILILDEPTTGLDPNQILEFRQLISRIGKEKTVILSTHILQEVEAICDHVLIMNQGKILAEGTKDEVVHSLKGEQQIALELKGIEADQAVESLSKLDGVSTKPVVHSHKPLKLTLSFLQESQGPEKVFDWAVKTGCKILSMVPATVSLQDIFTKLTREDG